ncbi:hypothetical protein [Prosthecomicrobium sp. N25]
MNDTLERPGYIPNESDLRRFDLIGGAVAVLMILGPLLAGAMHG